MPFRSVSKAISVLSTHRRLLFAFFVTHRFFNLASVWASCLRFSSLPARVFPSFAHAPALVAPPCSAARSPPVQCDCGSSSNCPLLSGALVLWRPLLCSFGLGVIFAALLVSLSFRDACPPCWVSGHSGKSLAPSVEFPRVRGSWSCYRVHPLAPVVETHRLPFLRHYSCALV